MKSIILIGLGILTLASGAGGGLKTKLVSKAIEKLPEKVGIEVELTKDDVSTLTEIVINHSDKATIKDIKAYVETEDYEGLYEYGMDIISDSEEESLEEIYEKYK